MVKRTLIFDGESLCRSVGRGSIGGGGVTPGTAAPIILLAAPPAIGNASLDRLEAAHNANLDRLEAARSTDKRLSLSVAAGDETGVVSMFKSDPLSFISPALASNMEMHALREVEEEEEEGEEEEEDQVGGFKAILIKCREFELCRRP
jgi:hypothetical protein